MEIKKLCGMIDEDQEGGSLEEKVYRKDLWGRYIEKKNMGYTSLSVKEAISRLVSEQNLRGHCHTGSRDELGVDIRTGGICHTDFDEAYISEIGYQHFGLIMTVPHNRAFVMLMSGNHTVYLQAYSKENPRGKHRLTCLRKIKGMSKKSVLFANDTEQTNAARIVGVEVYLRRDNELSREIKDRVKNCLD